MASNYKYYEAHKKYQSTKRGHISQLRGKAKERAKKKDLPYNLTLDYLESIATDCCPIFGTPFVWGRYVGGATPQSPSLDRVIPELGYVQGNVVFISLFANTVKQDITEKELYKIADWLHAKRKEVLNAFPKSVAPLSAGHYPKSKEHTKHGTVLATGLGEDDDHSYHHCGADARQDADHRAQESSGDSVAHRNKKVEPSPAFTRGEDNGESEPEISSVELRGGRLFD